MLEWIVDLTDTTRQLVHCWLRVSKFDFDVTQRDGITIQAAEALLWLDTVGTDTSELNNNYQVSFGEQVEKKINNDDDRKSDILCI